MKQIGPRLVMLFGFTLLPVGAFMQEVRVAFTRCSYRHRIRADYEAWLAAWRSL